MNRWRFAYKIIKRTGMSKMLIGFIIFYFVTSLIIYFAEPGVNTVSDALWYTFVAASSIGFGDFYPVTALGRLFTVLITIDEIVIAAMIPGVIVTYYTEYLKLKEKDTVTSFMEKLENLPSLSEEELAEISEKVKKYKMKLKGRK